MNQKAKVQVFDKLFARWRVHRYGKCYPEDLTKAIDQAMRTHWYELREQEVPVVVNGTRYKSVSHAAKRLRRSRHWVRDHKE